LPRSYWPSTAAFGMADKGEIAVDSPAWRDALRWPADLLRPTHLVLLTLSEQARGKRVRDRAAGCGGEGKQRGEEAVAVTEEERQLEASAAKRARVLSAYRTIAAQINDDVVPSKAAAVSSEESKIDRSSADKEDSATPAAAKTVVVELECDGLTPPQVAAAIAKQCTLW
jgi:hypothetical protein